jgi:hypothetical protein
VNNGEKKREKRKRACRFFPLSLEAVDGVKMNSALVCSSPTLKNTFERARERASRFSLSLSLSRHADANPATAAPCRSRRCRRHDAAALADGASARERAGSRGINVDRGVARVVVARGFRGRRCGRGRPARQARLHGVQDTVRVLLRAYG